MPLNWRGKKAVWLVLDIGNSAVKGGLYEDGRLHHTFRAAHETASLATTLRAEIQAQPIERAGFSSVVPRSTAIVSNVLAEAEIAATPIEHSMKIPFELAYRTPETLGTDRLAAAAAAWLLYGRGESRGVIALDAGTAFTYEVIDRNGVYQGGAISPGPGLMQRSLNRDTAQLPEVPLSLPDEPIGRSTVEAIQAGIMFGFIESVRGLLNRINGMLREDAFVVVTGGWGTLIKEQVSDVDAVEPHLVLEGVRLLMEMNG